MHLTWTGDSETDDNFSIQENQNSPGQIVVIDLNIGDNVIIVPSAGSSVSVGCVIIPPAGNTVATKLKGINSDDGFLLHPTNPIAISFGGEANFVLHVESSVDGFRFNFF